jgi:glucose-1-phosphate thymidylyltransferase
MEIVGLIPAGGKGERIAPLPCSKELYPIGFGFEQERKILRPKVVSHFLLEKMRKAKIFKSYFVIREGKWDIPAYFRDGKMLGMHLAYLLADLPFGVPYTVDQAYPFLQHSMVAFGFPDILFQPDDAFVKLIEKQAYSGADLVLGLVPAPAPQSVDMVDVDLYGSVRKIIKKPSHTVLEFTWVIALWTPVFMEFLHGFITDAKMENKVNKGGRFLAGAKEITMGEVIQIALSKGLKTESVTFPNHYCIDIGTPENLFKAHYKKNSI